jgi:hypothetical protein
MVPSQTSLVAAHVHSGIHIYYMLFYARAARDRALHLAVLLVISRDSMQHYTFPRYLPMHPWPRLLELLSTINVFPDRESIQILSALRIASARFLPGCTGSSGLSSQSLPPMATSLKFRIHYNIYYKGNLGRHTYGTH